MEKISAYKISCSNAVFLTEKAAKVALNDAISKKLHKIGEQLACKNVYGIVRSFEDKALRELLVSACRLINEEETGIAASDEEN